MVSKDLVFRFFGIDAGAGREFDRMAAKTAAAGSSWAKFAKAGVATAAVVGVVSVKMAMDFQKSTELIHTQAGVSQKALDQMRSGILGLAGGVATSPEKLSEAMFHLASTGLRGAKAMNALKIAAEGAKVGNADLTDVTNALNNVIVSGIKGSTNMAGAMGTLNAIVGAGDMHMQDLAEALGTGGLLTIAKQFGVSLDQVGGALAVFGDNTIRGSQAATYLRQAIQKISVPSAKADSALAQISLTSKQLSDSLVRGGLTGALRTLHDHFVQSGLATKEWGRILSQAFTVRAGQGVSILVSQFSRYMQKQKEAQTGAHTFGAAWTATTKTLSFQLDRLRADAAVLAIKLGDALMPIVAKLLSGFLTLARVVGDVASFFMHNTAAATALAAVLGAVLVPKVIEFVVWIGRVIAVNAAAAFIAIQGAVVAAAEAFTAAEGGVAGFSAAMATLDLNPIVLGISAVAAVVGALALGFMHSGNAAKKARQSVDDYVASLHVDYNSARSVIMVEADLTARIRERTAAINKMGAAQLFATTGRVNFTRADQEDTLAQFNQRLAEARQQTLALDPTMTELRSNLLQIQAHEKTATHNTAELSTTLGANKSAVVAAANALGLDLSGSFTSLAPKISAYIASAKLSHQPTKEAAAAFKSLGNAANDVTTDIGLLDTAWSNLIGNFVGAKVAKAQAVDAIVALGKAVHKAHGDLRGTSAASRAAIIQLGSASDSISAAGDAVYKSTNSYAATKRAVSSLTSMMIADLPKGSKAAKEMTAGVAKYLDALQAKMGTAGKTTGTDYVNGLVLGMRQGIGTVHTASADLGGQMIAGTRNRIIARSPAKQAIKLGQWYAQGLAIGMDSHGHMVYLSSRGVAHQLALGLTEGFKGESLKVEHSLSQSLQAIVTNTSNTIAKALAKQHAILKADKAKLNADLLARKQAISGLQDSIAGNSDLSNVLNLSRDVTTTGFDFSGSSAVANTTTKTISYTGNVASYLKGQAGLLKREASMFTKLRKMGLSPQFLTQISAMAPTDAISIMSQILSGSDGSIASLNAYEKQIRASAKQVASGSINTPNELQKLRHDRSEQHDQTQTLHKIERHLRHFRENPASKTEIRIALHELGFSDPEVRKLMKRMEKIRRESGGRVKVT